MKVRILVCCVVALVVPALSAAEEPAGFRWQDDADKGVATLMLGGKPVIAYMYAYDTSDKQRAHETYKVYHHVFGPGTGERITKGPGGLYTHHRGLYVGWNRTKAGGKSFDFWHCSRGAHLRHVKFVEKKADASHGTMTALIHWNDGEGKPVIVETRTITVGRDGAKAWRIEWSTKLVSKRGDIELNGDRQHAGFQFRAAQDVAKQKSARYIRPAGFPQQSTAFQVNDRMEPNKHVDLGWLAMHYTLKGTTYTVEYFEAPGYPKPSRYSERPYGRFGAFYVARLTEKTPLTMRYRVRISAGKPSAQAEIAKRYKAFLAGLKSVK